MSAEPRPLCRICKRRMHYAELTEATPARRRPAPHQNRCMDCPADHFACGCKEAYYDFERWKGEVAILEARHKKS